MSRDTGSTVQFSDTSPKAREIYFERLKEMTPAERVRIGIALWNAADSIQRSAILCAHPEIDEGELVFRLAARRFGRELAQKVYRKS